MVIRKGWNKNDLRDVLYEALKMPFETWELTIGQLKEEGRTYENYKNIAMQLEKKLKDRKELFLEERIEARFVKETERFKRKFRKFRKHNRYDNKKRKFGEVRGGKNCNGKGWKAKDDTKNNKGKAWNGSERKRDKKEKDENDNDKSNVGDVSGRRCHLCGSTLHLMKACPKFDPNYKERWTKIVKANKTKKESSSDSSGQSSASNSDTSTSSSSSSSSASAKIARKQKRKYQCLQAKETEDKIKFIGDSGASHHMINEVEALEETRLPKKDCIIKCANESNEANLNVEKSCE